MKINRISLFVAVIGGLILLSAAACSDSSGPAASTTGAGNAAPTTAATSATTNSPATSAAQPATTGSTGATAATSGQKVSANNATAAQLQAAFEAAGIPSAAQWAKEVQEYRPYPANDPTMAKLRQNLAKYNPAAGVVDKIVATLSLDQ